MITCKDQHSLTNAKSYFQEHLCGGDYYTENGRTFGQWFGTGCKLLNLTETIQEKDFLALCECKYPETGETLTQRIKKEKRRIFSDFVISCPKSVSLVATLQDERIFDLHEKSVKVALSEMEQFACTRVRKNNAMTDRETSNMIAGLFVHDTSRSLDPMVHTHCILFNATFDAVENKWKALQKYEILKVQKYISCIYNHELQKGLKQLGYSVHTKGTSFEIDGISDEMIKTFSKRHQAIEQAMQDHLANKGITARNIHDVKEQVRMQTRQLKNKNITKKELLEIWQQQCTEEDRRCLQTCNQYEPIQALTEDVEKRRAINIILLFIDNFRKKLLNSFMRKFFNYFLIFLFLSSIFSLSYAMKRTKGTKKGKVEFVTHNEEDYIELLNLLQSFKNKHSNMKMTIKESSEQSEASLEESRSDQEDQKKDIETEKISYFQQKAEEDIIFDQEKYAIDQETLTDLEVWSSINLEKLMAIREIEKDEERYQKCAQEISEQLTYYFAIYGNGIQNAIKELQFYITKAGDENQ